MTETCYTKSHEWARIEGEDILVGISSHAVEALGDIAYVELPEIGQQVAAGAEVAVVESVKAAADVYSPVTGEISAINEALNDNPQLLNDSPEEAGWFFRIKPAKPAPDALSELMSGKDYAALIEAQG